MKLLHAADLHLDSAFAGLPEEKAALCRQESRDILRRMVDWANDHEADVMLLAGDLFDSDRLYSQTARTLALTLGRFRGRIFLAPGNHDFYAPGSGYSAVEWPENVHIFTSRTPQTVLLPEWNASVTGIAFTTAEEWEPFAGAAFAGSEAAVRLGVVHGEVTRGESKYRAISPAEIGKTDLTYLALGHVHRYGGVQRAGTTAYAYPGCLPGRGFDETGDKGFLFGDVTAEGADLEFIPFARRRYQSVTADVTDCDPAGGFFHPGAGGGAGRPVRISHLDGRDIPGGGRVGPLRGGFPPWAVPAGSEGAVCCRRRGGQEAGSPGGALWPGGPG